MNPPVTPETFAESMGAALVCSKPLPAGGWVSMLDRNGELTAATLRDGAEAPAVSPVGVVEALALVGLALAEPGAEWNGPALARLVRGAGLWIAELEHANRQNQQPPRRRMAPGNEDPEQ